VEKMPSVHNVEVKIRLEKHPARVAQDPEGHFLQWHFRDGLLHTVVPDMKLHTAIIIDI